MKWEDITIKQFKDIQDVLKSEEDETGLTVKLLAYLSGKEEDYFLDLPIDQFKKEAKLLDFLNEKPSAKIKERYTVNGQVFTLNVNVSKMPTAQYIDYTSVLQNSPDNYALLLSVLLIPEGKEYNAGYDIQENARLFENSFKWVDVETIAFFFSRLLSEYTKHTISYLTRKLKRLSRKEKNPQRAEEIQKAINHLKAVGSGISS